MVVRIAPGFSVTNRWLLYTSYCLAPAQFASGLGSNSPSNIGFLAYNWYTQIQWYQLMSGDGKVHAISLILPHFNLLYTYSYLGGVSSGNVWLSIFLAAGTAGVMLLNTAASWKAWAVHQSPGYGNYKFFFFGWRTLTEGWHRGLFLPWQIFDTLVALVCVFLAFHLGVESVRNFRDKPEGPPWLYRIPFIFVGAIVMLFFGWPLVLWTELIISRNKLVSETDMIAVWLFIAQVAAMLLPSLGLPLSRLSFLGGLLGRRKSSSTSPADGSETENRLPSGEQHQIVNL
ncbi:hypothetical protein VTH82DRAFT_5178 [Thermothelomyces myriococcoides]